MKVTDVVSIPGAKVPMIGFIYDGVDIDLLFAQLPKTSIPRNLDIGNDEILRGVDEGTLRCRSAFAWAGSAWRGQLLFF